MTEEEIVGKVKNLALKAWTVTETLEGIELLGELGKKGGKYAEEAVKALTEISSQSVTLTESKKAMETAREIVKNHFK